jgi:hypothetical protein
LKFSQHTFGERLAVIGGVQPHPLARQASAGAGETRADVAVPARLGREEVPLALCLGDLPGRRLARLRSDLGAPRFRSFPKALDAISIADTAQAV